MYRSLPEHVAVGQTDARTMVRNDLSSKVARTFGCTLLVLGWLLSRALGVGSVTDVALASSNSVLNRSGGLRSKLGTFEEHAKSASGVAQYFAGLGSSAHQLPGNSTSAVAYLNSFSEVAPTPSGLQKVESGAQVEVLSGSKSADTTTFKYHWGSSPDHEDDADDAWTVISDAEHREKGRELKCQVEQDNDYDKCVEVFYDRVWVPELSYSTKRRDVED